MTFYTTQTPTDRCKARSEFGRCIHDIHADPVHEDAHGSRWIGDFYGPDNYTRTDLD